ncbi:hypothetical protein M404DRAFT_487151 [Pisolithus tinctorius Marx 270]|uniref:Uncharacterized protein n=1 Tax=Pisolithus tinctorius Marx 270 TaxID=870435 RepID=A0A0C3NCT3_PISTI|nr:hypothetical protein M404DRAFT_487151 [Pisolithus tinctorius Marx 270]
MMNTRSVIPSPLAHADVKKHPYVVQRLDGTGIELLTLISSIRQTISARDFLAYSGHSTSKINVLCDDPIFAPFLDGIHNVFTSPNVEQQLHEVINGIYGTTS